MKKASTSLKAALKAALKDSDKDIYLPDEPEKRASLDEYNEYCHELLNTVRYIRELEKHGYHVEAQS